MKTISRSFFFIIFLSVPLLLPSFSAMAQQKGAVAKTQPGSGQVKVAVAQSNPQTVDLTKAVLDPLVVDTNIRAIVDKLKNEKDDKPLNACDIKSFSTLFSTYAKLPRIETDTRIYSIWYKSVAENLDKLVKLKQTMELASMNNETKNIGTQKTAYKESVQKLIYLIEHPQKVNGKGG